jgi:cobalamin biosynthesis protein CobC
MDQLAPQTSFAASAPEHGGRLAEARRLFPGAAEPFIDLSTGINPLPYPVPGLPEATFARLPEPEEIAKLEAAAAKAYGAADPAMVVAGPGAQSFIAAVPHLWPQARVAILGPTYGEYARSFAAAGAEVLSVERLEDAAAAGALVLCNPNNPDGRMRPAQTILALLKASNFAGLGLIDEAFADVEDPGLSLVPHLPQPRLIVLRSFSKAYGLAGLRLSFAILEPDLAGRLRAMLGPWPVSGPAIAIGARALADRGWLMAARARLESDVARLDPLLRAAGLDILGGTLLFRLVRSDDAGSLFHRLGRAGILIRRFGDHADWLRFGVPGDARHWLRLAQALG